MAQNYAVQSDEDLLFRSLDGDPSPFEELVRRYEDRLYRYVYRLVGDASEAEDLFQQAFLRAFRKRHLFRRESRFSTWIYTIATNCCRDELRRRGRHNVESEEDLDRAIQDSPLPARISGPDRQAQSREVAARVKDALDQLPEVQRTLVVLSHFEGMDYQSIADVLGCSMGTVKSGVHRAKQNLRNILSDVSVEQIDLRACEVELHELS